MSVEVNQSDPIVFPLNIRSDSAPFAGEIFIVLPSRFPKSYPGPA